MQKLSSIIQNGLIAQMIETHCLLSKEEVAEGKGFEPPEGVSSFNDLANRRLQPLGHPSANFRAWTWITSHGVCISWLILTERSVNFEMNSVG